MSELEATERWRPTRTNLVAGGIAITGLLLTGLSWWFFLLVALGTLGPGILRELGWLRDRDEFQRRADHRAGAYSATSFSGIRTISEIVPISSDNVGIAPSFAAASYTTKCLD